MPSRRPMSALPRKRTNSRALDFVSFVPGADSCTAAKYIVMFLALWRSLPTSERVKSVSVWHPHFREGLCIEDSILANNAVELQDIGDHRVDLVIGQRFRFVERH